MLLLDISDSLDISHWQLEIYLNFLDINFAIYCFFYVGALLHTVIHTDFII